MATTPDKSKAARQTAAPSPKKETVVASAETPETALTPAAPFSLMPALAGVQITLSGLQIAADTPITVAQYEEFGRGLAVMDGGMQWVMADYFNLGEDRFEGEALDVLERLGLADKTISNFRWVARKIPVERRRPELRFTHHAEVAALEPEKQDELLEKAVSEKWSSQRLRDEARIALKGDAVVLPLPPPVVQTAIEDAVETAEAAEIVGVPEGTDGPQDAPKDDFAAPLGGGGLKPERGEPVVIRNQAEAKGTKPATPSPAPAVAPPAKPAPAAPPAPAKPREPVTVHGPFYRANYTLKGGGPGGKDKVLQFEIYNTPEGDWEIFCDGKTFTKVGLHGTAIQKIEEYCHECKVAVEEARKNAPAGKGAKK